MTNKQLKEVIADKVFDQEELDQIIVLEGDEFADGAIGLTIDNHLVYDYNKLVESLMKHNDWSELDAIEWIDFNTIRSLPYMATLGNEPVIINLFEDLPKE